MRRMNTRQAVFLATCFLFFNAAAACSPSNNIPKTPTIPTPPPSATFTPPPPTETFLPPTPTSLACLQEPGVIEQNAAPTSNPPQEFLIYLPPCYANLPSERYPVLYLLHGQTYTQDQWVRMGAPTIADRMIHAGESQPFIMVFPDDRYWNSAAGPGFGDRFINDLIPFVDQNYRTLASRQYRFLGGLSRGGGWTVKLGLARPDLFGALGLHSPAVFKEDAPVLERMIRSIAEEERPRLWLDTGDQDMELSRSMFLEDILTRAEYPHEFHFFPGDHSEVYWSAHVDDYLRWYAQAWRNDAAAP